MSGLKDIAKGGWHPKGKDGKSKESWRGDFKGIEQVSRWVGHPKAANAPSGDNEHVARPISTLKDPSAFGPPPKNVNFHGGAALPNQITPDTRGWGAPLSKEEIAAKAQQKADEEAQREEAEKPKGPPIPFRADTTGLSTANLPPPPGRTDGADGRTPSVKPKPSLPPRLPPRQDSNLATPPPAYASATTQPDAHKGILNQGSLSRLSAAGVSVPEFGIGAKGRQTAPPPSASPSSRTSASSINPSQLNELQSRFSRLSSSTSPKPGSPSEGTSFAQKQAALKTASSFRRDPSSVTFSDAKAAASTANNFRERHGDQVKSGWQSANKLNNKYGIADKVGNYGGLSNTQTPESSNQQIDTRESTISNEDEAPDVSAIRKKKPPPPPPMKRAGLGAGIPQSDVPPPVPLSSKPKPQVGVSH